MRSIGPATLLAVALTAQIDAQELGIHGAAAEPGPYTDVTFGVGAWAAAYTRLGAIFAEETRLSRSRLPIGLRLAYTQFGVRSRLEIVEATVLLRPYRTSSMRVEVGGGLAHYALGAETPVRGVGFTISAAGSRRLVPNRSWWATLEYMVNGPVLGGDVADGPNLNPPIHSLRLGGSYRLRRD